MTWDPDAAKAAVNAAMDVAAELSAGRMSAAALDAAVAAECGRLFSRVEGPGDPLWEMQVDICRQVLAVGGGVSADELAEWVAVYRHAEAAEEGEPADGDAAAPVPPGPSWIEQALAEDAGVVD